MRTTGLRERLAAFGLLILLAGCFPATPAPVDGWTNPQGTPATPEPALLASPTPSATATEVIATPSTTPTEAATLTPTVMDPATPVPGWKKYSNAYLGYQFNYPETAAVHPMGFTGMPTDDPLPPGFASFEEYFAYAEAVLPPELCVTVENGAGSLTISPPYASIGRFASPCPGMGIGSGYRMEPVTQRQWIAGAEYDLQGNQLYLESSGEFSSEFYSVELNNGFRVTLIGMPPPGMSAEEYNGRRQELFEILMTLGWGAYPDLTLPGSTCAGKFTRLMPGVAARVTSAAGAARNLHAQPDASSAVLRTLAAGAIVRVLQGPVCTAEQVFWLVAASEGERGWMAEGDYQEYFLMRNEE